MFAPARADGGRSGEYQGGWTWLLAAGIVTSMICGWAYGGRAFSCPHFMGCLCWIANSAVAAKDSMGARAAWRHCCGPLLAVWCLRHGPMRGPLNPICPYLQAGTWALRAV